MQRKIVTVANGVNGGVCSIASEWEWDCLLAKLKAHCLEHVHTKKRSFSYASLPESGIFTVVACPVEFVSVPMEATAAEVWNGGASSQLTPPSPNSTLWVEEEDAQSCSRRRAKELQCIDLPSDFYQNYRGNQVKEKALRGENDLWKVYLGNDNQDEIAQVCSELAQDYLIHGNSTEAMKLYRKSLSIRLSFWGKNHPSVSKIYNNIGTVYWMQGDHEEARRMHQMALTTRLDAIEERYSEARWGEAKLGQYVKSNALVGTCPTRDLADAYATTEIGGSRDSLTQDSSLLSNNVPSLTSEELRNEGHPISSTTASSSAAQQQQQSRMNPAPTTLRDNCNLQHASFSYLIQ